MAEIKTMLIFEMLGRPPEHLKETFVKFMDALAKEPGVNLSDRKINEPKKVENSRQELYTTFAEAEVGFSDLASLMRVAFVYMPSHIEIISPSEINIKNFELNNFMNALVMKLHQYDEIAKGFMVEKHILESQLREKAANSTEPIKQEEKKEGPVKKKARKGRKKKE